jgi:TatD DNase family protein
MRWIDAGVNLTNSKLFEAADAVISSAEKVGVIHQIVIGTSLQDSEQAVALCERFPQQLRATVGIHPHDAAAAKPSDFQRLRELAQHPAVIAIGECGLDFYRNYSPAGIQKQVFLAQLEIAAEMALPVYLHERSAHQLQIEYLTEFRQDIPKMLAHCFTGGHSELVNYLELDCYIGISGWLCDERRGYELQQAVPEIPLNRYVLETDAPFLLPRTIKPRPAYNEPRYLPEIGVMLATILKQEVHSVAAQAWQNTMDYLGE